MDGTNEHRINIRKTNQFFLGERIPLRKEQQCRTKEEKERERLER